MVAVVAHDLVQLGRQQHGLRNATWDIKSNRSYEYSYAFVRIQTQYSIARTRVVLLLVVKYKS